MPEIEKKVEIGGRVITSISMSEEQLETLDLLTLSNEESRSGMISKWISDRSNISTAIKTIANRIMSNYSKVGGDFDNYMRAAEVWLFEKKISQYYIKKISQEVKKLHEA